MHYVRILAATDDGADFSDLVMPEMGDEFIPEAQRFPLLNVRQPKVFLLCESRISPPLCQLVLCSTLHVPTFFIVCRN